MKAVVLTRYKPETVGVKIGAANLKAQVAVHFGYWFCSDCEVKPAAVWSGGIYHGAGLIDFAMRYFNGDIKKFHPSSPVNIDGMIAGLEGAEPYNTGNYEKAGAYVGTIILAHDIEYKFSLNRPPAPPDVEYPENPLLYYLTLTLMLPNEGWEKV